jgi:hypothetical protein
VVATEKSSEVMLVMVIVEEICSKIGWNSFGMVLKQLLKHKA